MKDRFVAKRSVNFFLMLLVSCGFTVAICLLHDMWIDEMLGVLLLNLIFFALFSFALEHARIEKKLAGNRENDYGSVLAGCIASAILIFAASFCPEFLKPVILVPFVMTRFSSKELALCTGIFWNAILGLAVGMGSEEMILCCLLTLFGKMLSEMLANEKHILWVEIIVICISAMLPELFYYLTYQEINMWLFVYGAAEGVLTALVLLLLARILPHEAECEIPSILEEITDEDYPAARELLNFSRKEYEHASRVSRIAQKCADLVGADEKLCAAAGFYYRIGIIEGNPIAEKGIRIAQKYCFPEEVIRILSEYEGETELPSTVESAIVHMVNGLIKKMEVLDRKDALSSEWNQDMVIYQTLNEFSAKGLYDKSGLSMNMFLKIREYLVKEEALL